MQSSTVTNCPPSAEAIVPTCFLPLSDMIFDGLFGTVPLYKFTFITVVTPVSSTLYILSGVNLCLIPLTDLHQDIGLLWRRTSAA